MGGDYLLEVGRGASYHKTFLYQCKNLLDERLSIFSKVDLVK
jgi:hypothetical protein